MLAVSGEGEEAVEEEDRLLQVGYWPVASAGPAGSEPVGIEAPEGAVGEAGPAELTMQTTRTQLWVPGVEAADWWATGQPASLAEVGMLTPAVSALEEEEEEAATEKMPP